MSLYIDYFKEFVTLADVGNFWEASYRLYMNQSTLSKHIQVLEDELGVKLFDRSNRHVKLTQYGEALLPYARQIMRIQFEYSADLKQLKDAEQGTITIGTIPPMAQYHVTGLLFGFEEAYEDYSVRILEADSKELLAALKDKRCELAFIRESTAPGEHDGLADDRIARIPYIEDRLVAVLPEGHPLCGSETISMRDLECERLCMLKENTMVYNMSRDACLAAGFVPNIVFDSHHIDSILDRVTRGDDVALVMKHHVTYPEGSGMPADAPFTVVPVEPAVRTWVSLCYMKDREHSPACHAFVEYFMNQEAAQSDVEW